jgi:hypothetical protein
MHCIDIINTFAIYRDFPETRANKVGTATSAAIKDACRL